MKKWISASLVAFSLVAIAGSAFADPPSPPPEAFTACANAKSGDACTVQLRDRSVDGTCKESRSDSSKLFCLPKDMPPPPHAMPPLPTPPL